MFQFLMYMIMLIDKMHKITLCLVTSANGTVASLI